ncbi:MAG: CRISPR-associated endonuclease Cas2 [Anaeroplasma sp.]
MRLLLFFDLPSVSKEEKRTYSKFVKQIKCNGFYMLQESVYAKMALNKQVLESTIEKVNKFLPPNGYVIVLPITEKQFNNMTIMLGENKSNVVSSNERIIIL